MAKRKGAATKSRKTAAKRTRSSRSRKGSRKTRRVAARKATRAVKKTGRAAGIRARKASARKTAARQSRGKAPARKATRKAAPRATARKTPALNRARRTVQGEDIVPTPPSSLDLDRSASAARSGRREMQERRSELTQTGPALTGGDVDADWESAYSVGDEAPGGDNPTPDQDIVDDIGRAVGNEYEDNEELKGDTKIRKRDIHRWELDPASSEDYNDR